MIDQEIINLEKESTKINDKMMIPMIKNDEILWPLLQDKKIKI